MQSDQALVSELRKLRETYEREHERLLNEHMEAHYRDVRTTLWYAAKRASLDVASWPEWKRKAALSKEAMGDG